MSKKRQEAPGIGGNGVTSKSVVQQGLTPIFRGSQELRIGNPLVVGSSPTRPTQRLFCKIRLAESSFMGGEVPASAPGIQRFDGSLPSRPDNVQRFAD